MRASRHNGRAGKNGSYNPKHNDREFDVDKAEDIDSERTQYNVYWNCVDRELVQHKDRDENWHSFTEVETAVYGLLYKDYLEGQNARNIAARHKERCRTMDDLRTSNKTCPEETIYQIGNIDGTVDVNVLMDVAFEFFNTISERYGEHVHVLNWPLHLDESTPHIHERHVFDVINKYGERQPKQEQALKELGFELPDPSKKEGKYNNRKMSYDAECRKLFIEICKKHGIEIEEEPIYGGKKYLEKQEYIIEKLNADYKDLQEKFDTIDDLYTEALRENERLTATVREGVKWLPEKQLDVFFVTLNKSDKDYSPTTMYNDYSINENLFHWQSQSTTAENSSTGQRYIHQREHGSKVLLFVREFKSDRVTGGAEAYTYLGAANYVKHQGSRPMNITWHLDRPIPAKFLKKTNKLVVG